MKVVLLFAFAVFLVDCVPLEEYIDETESVEPEYLDQLLSERRYEEFSKLMGISNPLLAIPGNGSDKIDPYYHKDLFEGDIILTPWQEEMARQGMNLHKYPRSKWPDEIPYVISGEYSETERNRIQSAIDKWNELLGDCIYLVPRTNQRDFIHIFPGQGCYALLGKRGNQQPVSLEAPGCLRIGTIQHEIAHSCGIVHEQSRPDRDSCVKVLFENIAKNWHSQYNKEIPENFVILGPYDCESAMHYPNVAPGSNKRAFEFLNGCCPDQRKVGQRNGLNAIDVKKLRTLYGCD